MDIFHYDPSTGEFLGRGVSESDPRTGHPLLPAGATFDQPTTPPEGSVSVFKQGVWSVVEDYRGVTVYDVDGLEKTIDTLGPILDGYSLTPPPIPEPTLEEVKQQALSDLAAVRYVREVGGVDVGGLTIPTADRDKLLIDGLYRRAEKDPGLVQKFKTPSGFIDLSAPDIIAIGDAVAQHVQNQFDWEAAEFAKLEAVRTVEEIDTIRGGWV